MSPIQYSTMPTGAIDTGAADSFTERTGRKIYEEKTISGLNRLPIETLISFIIGGSKFESPPFDIEDLAERLLVDGTIVIYDNEYLGNIVYADELKVVQRLEVVSNNDKPVTRVFKRENKDSDRWTSQDFEDYGLDTQKEISEEIELPAKTFFAYINGVGILSPNQKQFWRIEQIFVTMMEQTSGPGLVKKILSGYVGSIESIRSQMDNKGGIICIPGGDTKLFDVASDMITNQLIAQLDKLVPNYFRNLHVIDTEGAANVSGISRKLLMTPMTTFVEKVRGWIIEVCAYFNYVPVFAQLPMDSIEEREKELNLLENLLAKQVITQAEFTAKARELTAI